MNEARRQHYLKQLGVEHYWSRWRLPLAPEPRPVLYRSATPVGARSAAVESVRQIDKEVAPALEPSSPRSERPRVEAPLEAPLEALSKSATIVQSKPTLTSEASATGSVEPFDLAIWRLSDQLVLVDSRQEMPLPTEVLVANLVAALGYRETLSETDFLRRPVVSAQRPLETADRAHFVEMVDGYFDALFARHTPRVLCLLGAAAAHWVLDKPQPFSQLLGKHFTVDRWLGGPVSVVVTHSLGAMLHRPELKRDCWRALAQYRVV